MWNFINENVPFKLRGYSRVSFYRNKTAVREHITLNLNEKSLCKIEFHYSKINCRLVYNTFMGDTIVMAWDITPTMTIYHIVTVASSSNTTQV